MGREITPELSRITRLALRRTLSDEPSDASSAFTVHAPTTDADTYDGQTTYRRTRTDFDYDSYGNRYRTDEYGEGTTVLRRTLTTYYAPGSTRIANKLQLAEVYDAETTLIAITRYAYDGLPYGTVPITGNLTRVEATTDGATFFPQLRQTFDTYGNVVIATDALGHAITTTYDTVYHRFPVTVTNARGHTATSTYDLRFGKPITTTDANGAITSYRYDGFGRQTTLTRPRDQGSGNPT